MLKQVLCYSLLWRQARVMPLTKRHMASKAIDPAILARSWTSKLSSPSPELATRAPPLALQNAVQRTLPLLQDTESVPFVCRYRTDVIHPLSVEQVHELSSLLTKHAALSSLRTKVLAVMSNDNQALVQQVQASTSKAYLEDLYAPFKPPSKGSILEQIQKEQPALVLAVDQMWDGTKVVASPSGLEPREALVHLLASKIAADPVILDAVLGELAKHCRLSTTSTKNADPKYRNYEDFSSNLFHLRDHQVLAIRRGVDQKAIRQSFDIDADKMQGSIRWNLIRNERVLNPNVSKAFQTHKWRPVVEAAVHDAWTRLLRRRGTSRLWNDKVNAAKERAMQVFSQNLHRALLAPSPLDSPKYILAVDPGFQAGIKCAILDPDGAVERLETVLFLGNKHAQGVEKIRKLILSVHSLTCSPVIVALGNGHGSQECRSLVEEAAAAAVTPIEIHLISEAGASVWSVTPSAKTEFPDQGPAAIAAVSIGRRLQNPLHELVKVPPRSLGLGMYQHDLSEKELDGKLHITSVDAVATVGVDVNTCSVEILQKVPGLGKLAEKVIQARPLTQRKDLLSVAGLGPKAFENCVAFIRIVGPEALDATLVHPESYEIAHFLLSHFGWTLTSDNPPRSIPREGSVWDNALLEASAKFGVTRERALAVTENLVDSITKVDPRLRYVTKEAASAVGSTAGCVSLPPALAAEAALRVACPLRGIVGTIRNIADFGAFVDFGGHSDGLVHTTKSGPIHLKDLLIGKQVGIDILSVQDGRASLGLTGLMLEPSPAKHRRGPATKKPSKVKGSLGVQKRLVSTTSKSIKSKKGPTKRPATIKGEKTRSTKRRRT